MSKPEAIKIEYIFTATASLSRGRKAPYLKLDIKATKENTKGHGRQSHAPEVQHRQVTYFLISFVVVKNRRNRGILLKYSLD